MQEQDPIKAIIKKVGRGKTLARDLTRDEARDAIERLLRGEFTLAQSGAFLQAMRIKETTVEELIGAAWGASTFWMGQFPLQPMPYESPLVVNLSFDTPRKGGVISLVALAYLKSQGLVQSLVVWEPPTIFETPGSIDRTLAAIKRVPKLAKALPVMVTVREFCPHWEFLSSLRKELGFRSILNTIEKLLRPWETAPVVLGISHDTFSQRLCHVLHALGASSGAVVRGHHGTCDLSFGEKPNEVNRWNGDQITENSLVASQFPWRIEPSGLLVSSLDSWGDWIADESSALWGMIYAQAAFLLAVAKNQALPEAIKTIKEHSKN